MEARRRNERASGTMIIWLFFTLAAVVAHSNNDRDCGGTLTASTGVIQSPNYPSRYPRNTECVWIIKRPWGERITLTFTDFSLDRQHHKYCRRGDTVTVYDGATENSKVLDTFCGRKLPPVRRTFQNTMRIRFRSSGYRTGTGFQANYSIEASNDTFFLITDSADHVVYHIDYDTFSQVTVDVTSHPLAVDYDPVDRRMYWTDLYIRDIHSAYLNGSDSRVLWSSPYFSAQISGLAVDSLSRLVFYADETNHVIGMVTMETRYHKTIISGGSPRSIALDNRNGVLYWTDGGDVEKIERANYDGSQRTILVSSRLHTPNGLVVDLSNRRLYWVDAGFDRVESTDLDGNNRTVLYSSTRWILDSHFYGLALHKNKLYITDWVGHQILFVSDLLEVRTDGRGDRTVGTSMGRMNDVHIYSDDTRDHGPNGCSNSRTSCSHICIPTPNNSFKCLCPDGLALGADNRNCLNGSTNTTRNPSSSTTTSRPASNATTTDPRTVRISGPDIFDTNGTQLMTLVCDPDGWKPERSVRWSVTCSSRHGRTCMWKPLPQDDDGTLVTCYIHYRDGQSASGSFQVRLNYPPPVSPVIHGYTTGNKLYTGDKLRMTCIVYGGKPLVTSVSFSCTGHSDGLDYHSDRLAQVQSTLVIDPLTAKDNGIRCECTASWKGTDMYTLIDFVWLRVAAPDSVPVTVSRHSGSNAAVAGGVAAGIGVLLLIIIVVIVLVVFMKLRKKRRDSPRRSSPPVVWHADTNLYNPTGYTAHGYIHGEPPPAYSNSIYDTVSGSLGVAGAEGGQDTHDIAPPKYEAPPSYASLGIGTPPSKTTNNQQPSTIT